MRESTQDHFKDGIIRVDNLEAAWHALDNYRQEAQEQKEQNAKKQNLNNEKKS